MSDWNTAVINEFRANGGKVAAFGDSPMVLLHHIGAKSGTERVSPLVYLPDGDDLVVAATKGGHPAHPDWYHNLKAHPRVAAEVGEDVILVDAVETEGEERDELWRRLVEMRPGFAEYESKTTRVFPMFRLTPVR